MTAAADSNRLLREFAEHRSETAFAGLVRQHLNLVYSVALRRCGGQTGLAADVSQTVFCDLARKAGTLPADVVLAGWLYQHATYVAANLLRAEARRQKREELAMQLQTQTDSTDWSQIAPLLDDALLELSAADRDSLVLRFLEKQPLAEVGARLGLTENTARMRVERALEKLRVRLAQRGVTSTASALALALGGPAVIAAPPALTTAIIATALTAAATTTTTTGLLALMASTKLKAGLGLALFAAVTAPLLWQQHNLRQLRTENTRLRDQLAAAPISQPLVTRPAPAATNTANDSAELLRLRGQVAQLQREKADLASQLKHATVANGNKPTRPEPPAFEPVEFTDVGAATPDAAAQSFLWALLNTDGARFADLMDANITSNDGSPIDKATEFGKVAKEMKGHLDADGVRIGKLESFREFSDRSAQARFELDDSGTRGTFVLNLRRYGNLWKVQNVGKRPAHEPIEDPSAGGQ